MDLSIIIVSYNTRLLTLECLKSIFRETTGLDFEVIVFDNSSNDRTSETIAVKFPQVRLIANRENYGFAKANNMASQFACGEYLLMLNPDTVVLDHAIEKLYKFANAFPEAGIYGGRTIFPDGSLNPTCCFGKMTIWSVFCRASGLSYLFKKSMFFNPESYGAWRRDSVKQVDIITGCFFMIKTELWRKLGGFNPLFFMFGEEADLCLRAAETGVRPLFTPDAQIIHYGGKSELIKANRYVKVLCAEVTLIREHWPKFTAHIGIAMLVILVKMKSLILFILTKAGLNVFVAKAKTWEEVWRRRQEWRKGWYLVL
jgi:N-acetylglucosaminyl-diphospho-decaprenol L-rhamnosyltransferase